MGSDITSIMNGYGHHAFDKKYEKVEKIDLQKNSLVENM